MDIFYIICGIFPIIFTVGLEFWFHLKDIDNNSESKEEKIKRINKEYEKELEDRFNRLLS